MEKISLPLTMQNGGFEIDGLLSLLSYLSPLFRAKIYWKNTSDPGSRYWNWLNKYVPHLFFNPEEYWHFTENVKWWNKINVPISILYYGANQFHLNTVLFSNFPNQFCFKAWIFFFLNKQKIYYKPSPNKFRSCLQLCGVIFIGDLVTSLDFEKKIRSKPLTLVSSM